MKKRITLFALALAFSAQLLQAQRSGSISIPTCPLEEPCDPDPTPTPLPPPPTPTPTPAGQGVIGPKYIVLSVTYAPPGKASFATYSGSTLFGSSISFARSLANTSGVTATLQGSAPIPAVKVFGGSSTSLKFTQQSDTTVSLAVTDMANETDKIAGPLSSGVGIDHNQDIIWLWLNPVMVVQVPSLNSILWNSFAFDDRDPAGDLDIIGVPVAYLNGHDPMPSDIAAVLARGWASPVLCTASDPDCGPDGTKGPGLTARDFAEILKGDPFTDPSYLIDVPPDGNSSAITCTSDGRFCHNPNINHTFQYLPPPPGGQPITQTFTETRTANLSLNTGITTSFQVGFSKEFGFSPSDDLSNNLVIGDFLKSLKVEDTLTITDKLNLMNNLQVSQISSFSITGPNFDDHYTGPVLLSVFQDNVYGTFMFGAIPQPTFSLSISPTNQNAAQNSCVNYTVVMLAIGSSNSTVTLSSSGLPPDMTTQFAPSTITGAGSSTLTVCASPSSQLGTSTFQVKGVSGIEAHSTSASVNVTPIPNFFLTAAPASQTVLAGGPSAYTITVNPQNGFTGVVTLSASGAPAGTTVSFSPPSITGSGSSTLTIATTAGTPLGLSTITILGTSGSLNGNISVSLNVTSSSAPPDFTLDASPSSQTVNAGDSATYTVFSSALNGFNGTVNLSVSGGNGDIFVFLSPSSISANGSATLTISTSSTASGTYFVTITGTSGSLTRSASVSIDVNSSCFSGICPLQ